MSVQWETVLASAGVSAITGAVVSVLTISQITVRKARAERREASRLAVRAAVEPLLQELTRYIYADARITPKRDTDQTHLEDFAHVLRVRAAARDLPAWRRALVDRRCRHIFGPYWVDLARDYPTSADADPSSATFAARLGSSMSRASSEREAPASSLFHRTYATPPSKRPGKRLTRELELLAKAR